MTAAYIISDAGILNFLSTSQKPYTVNLDHPNYDTIMNELDKDDMDEDYVLELIDVPTAVTNFVDGKVEVLNGEVLYDGRPLHNILVDKILNFMSRGLPSKSLVKFLENLMQNPSRRSVEQLYSFLEHTGLPITPDGHFLGYKGVDNNYLDVRTKSFDNSPGSTHSMPRNEVNDDPEQACSFGFHIGTEEYAKHWGPTVVLVKVNPKDCVSVPNDSSHQKLRVCAYTVVGDFEEKLDNDYDPDDNKVMKKYHGVTFDASRSKYRVRVYTGGKEISLGYSDTAKDAAHKYNDYVQKHGLDKPLNTV